MKEKLPLLVSLIAVVVLVATGIITVQQAAELTRTLVELLAQAIEIAQQG